MRSGTRVVFALALDRSGWLWVAIAVHMGNNAVAFALLRLRSAPQSVAERMPIELCFATLLALSAGFIALNENVFTRPEMRQSTLSAFSPALEGDLSTYSLIWCLVLVLLAYPLFAVGRRVRAASPVIGSSSIHN